MVSDADGNLRGSDVESSKLNLFITASVDEINVLKDSSASTADLNKLSSVTASAAEINVLKDSSASTADLNKLSSVTASAAEINVLKDSSTSTADLNKLSSVTASAKFAIAAINLLDPSTDIESVTLTDNDGFILHDKGTPNQVKIAKLSDLKTYTGNNNLTFSAVTENNSNPSTSSQIKTYVDGQITTVNSSISGKQDSLTFGLDATNSLKVQTALEENDILIGGSSDVVPLVLPKGSILVGNGSSKPQKLTIGDTNGQVLTVDSNQDLGVKWATVSGGGGGGGGGDSSNGMF